MSAKMMAASRSKGLKRYFLGSLASDVAEKCPKPVMLVYSPHHGAEEDPEPAGTGEENPIETQPV